MILEIYQIGNNHNYIYSIDDGYEIYFSKYLINILKILNKELIPDSITQQKLYMILSHNIHNVIYSKKYNSIKELEYDFIEYLI